MFRRGGIPFRSVSGHLYDDNAWARIGRWISAAAVRGVLRYGRHGLMGSLYPGMLDVSTDMTLISTQLGGHMRVLEFDNLRVRDAAVSEKEVAERVALAREVFTLDASVDEDDLGRAARVSLGSTASSRTSRSIAAPTTTAAWTARSTHGSAPA